MKTARIVVLAALVLSGCAHTILRDPKTGTTVDCDLEASKATPGDWRGEQNPFSLAFAHRGCVESHKAAGYECVQGAVFGVPIKGKGC